MSTAIQTAAPLDAETMNTLMAGGDTSRLNAAQKNAYYLARCEAAGLDPRAQPFAFMRLSGKEVLYALKGASDQLAARHGIRCEIVSQATEDGIRVVTVRAIAKDGRQTDEIGAVTVKGLQGDALCNAMMKAVTKAKRRATLSICGLGMMDETEIETVPAAAPVEPARPHVEIVKPAPEAKPAPAEGKAPTPPHVVHAWEMAKRIHGNAKDAAEPFKVAVQSRIGSRPSSTMTEEEALDVEAILAEHDQPRDVPF